MSTLFPTNSNSKLISNLKNAIDAVKSASGGNLDQAGAEMYKDNGVFREFVDKFRNDTPQQVLDKHGLGRIRFDELKSLL